MSGKNKGKWKTAGRSRNPNSAPHAMPSSTTAAGVGSHNSPTTTENAADVAHPDQWRFIIKISALALVVGAIVLVPLMLLRVPTRIVADLVLKRLVFLPGHEHQLVTIIDQSTAFEALTIEKFSKVSFRPARLAMLHLAPGTRFAERLSVEPGTDVAIHGNGNWPASFSMTAPGGDRTRLGRLEAFSAQTPAVITFGSTPGTPPMFTISVAGQMQAPSILPSGPFDLTTQHTTLTGAALKQPQDVIRMRVVLSEASPYLETLSGSNGLTLTVTPVGAETVYFLGKGGISIEKIELVTLNSHGDLESSLAGKCAIIFPDFPNKKSVEFTENDSLSLESLDGMSITALSFSPQQGVFSVKLEGKAGKVQSKSGTATVDHRPSLLDWLLNNGYLQAVLALFSVILGALMGASHIEELLHKLRG